MCTKSLAAKPKFRSRQRTSLKEICNRQSVTEPVAKQTKQNKINDPIKKGRARQETEKKRENKTLNIKKKSTSNN